MRKQLLRIAGKELLIQSLILLMAWGIVEFMLSADVLTYNLWGSEGMGRPLKTEYVIVILVAGNMIRLSMLALMVLLKKETHPERSEHTYIFAHH